MTKNYHSISQKKEQAIVFSIKVEDIETELPECKISELNGNDLAVNVILSAQIPNKTLA